MKIIIGSGAGDEGKGLTTSYLCSQAKNPLVVRFSGSCQAGHTVVHNGYRHVFSNFGSGTLQGTPTYWSEYCPFSPLGALNEYNALRKNGIDPTLYVHPLAPVITPYDRVFNCNLEKSNKHGSCGLGVGSTIQRQEDHYKLFVQDLFHEKIMLQKLENIKSYYAKKMGILPAFIDFNMGVNIEDFRFIVNEVKKIIKVSSSHMLSSYDLIFEGSQGILLDQDFGFFPNVTRSNTTSKNALAIINSDKYLRDKYLKMQMDDVEIYYITRAYQTRHGNGYMTNEGRYDLKLKNTELETNVTNEWQGDFRKSVLDLDLLEYAIRCDANFSPGSLGIKKNMVITCVDQIDGEIPVTIKDELHYLSIDELANKMPAVISNVYFSNGDTKDEINQCP